MKTVELTGTVDEHGGIALAAPLSIEPATPVGVVIYYEEAGEELSRQPRSSNV